MIPDDLQYTDQHEWIRMVAPDIARVGITDYAQNQLGDIVFVELPEIGSPVSAGREFGEVESTKSTSDLVAPLSGEVVRVNTELGERPELVNSDPYGAGWLLELRVADPSERSTAGLLDAAGYATAIA
ncbi:Glycine cleavage system H protein [Pseudonocardia dioxanivorans CB1190]|uniref:Glycine cleavage system H protein n=1 Tax=Pseudonocardia dioxanivorans (strain ATCC 55486 / DSM 44775 / JCM 13855 / CB1190) TaxID=675635 RepID=F4CYY3_PSEUX|nr:glycine cleavage system protein GcvH [Pseudonocardia dioxanivorans]AEA27708.1 Glycine cleavage system H protein [Pseudonocardia dioxanivorans CB1190]